MELGQFEMGYSVPVPGFSAFYTASQDYARLTESSILIANQACAGLATRAMERQAVGAGCHPRRNSASRSINRPGQGLGLRIIRIPKTWYPSVDVEIHSELNETPQPGYQRRQGYLARSRAECGNDHREDRGTRTEARRGGQRVRRDPTMKTIPGPQLYLMTQDEISIGRGGDDAPVNVALYSNDEVSREHLRVREIRPRTLSDRRQEA